MGEKRKADSPKRERGQERYFAVVQGSLEKHALAELSEDFGITVAREVPRGLYFSADKKSLYRILYEARLLQRVLKPLLSFDCHSNKYLYNQAKKNINWAELFDLNMSFGIDSNVSGSFIKHSLYAGQILKDAICDSFRERFGERPDFSNKEPDILFNLHIKDNRADISLDIIGDSMHKRGYRKAKVQAPLQETLAAALVRLSGWQGETELWDPMCGSGTILAEALMQYCHIPAGYLRDYSRFEKSYGFDRELWEEVKTKADKRIREIPKGLIKGSDRDFPSTEAARQNLKALPFGERIEIKTGRIEDYKGEYQGTIICNPPYGVRLVNPLKIEELYKALGDFLKQRCKGSTAYVLCRDKDLVPALRLRAHWAKRLKNGNLDAAFAKIVIR